MAITTGITANTQKRIVADAGALYRDYGEVGEELIGATRGGATFTVERDDREVEVDGAMGPIKGLRRTIRHTAMLEVTLVEFSDQTFIDLTRGSSVSDGTHHTITPDNAIVAADYYTNIALVADVLDPTITDLVIIKLLDALNDNEWDLTVDDQDEGELGLTFAAHYDPAALSTVPYTIQIPVDAS